MSALVRPTQSPAASALTQAAAADEQQQQQANGELGMDSHHHSTHMSENDGDPLLNGKPAYNADEGDVEKLAQKETRNVRLWKLVVDAIILLAGAAVAIFTYHSLSKGEEEDYETAYRLFTNTVRDITEFRVAQLFQAHLDLSESITAHAIASNETWPFVTMPLFEVYGVHARTQSLIEGVAFCPLVRDADRTKWEQEYSIQHQQQIIDSQNVMLRQDITLHSESYIDEGLAPVIYAVNATMSVYPSPPAEVYSPVWQVSPPPFYPARMVNYNMLSADEMRQQYNALFATQDIVVSDLRDTRALTGTSYTAAGHKAFHDLYVTSAGNETADDRPHGWCFTPIFAQLGESTAAAAVAAASTGQSIDPDAPLLSPGTSLVGMLSTVIAFDNYLSNLLPDGIEGIHLVLTNNCNNSVTYELTGGRARYLGKGDLHDITFDHMREVVPFNSATKKKFSQDVPGHCYYEYHLYPTQPFVDGYKTNQPWMYTVLIAALFVIMAVTLFVYDTYVHRRNTRVVNQALNTNAIVTSLFPSTVRSELGNIYKEERQMQKAQQQQAGTAANPTRLRTFLTSNNKEAEAAGGMNSEVDDGDIILKGKPLADLFPETTIMFGDIAGFTAWSSVREPSQVFTLLETLYRAFDTIAKKRRIFKVETIGDCYVAVCGLPDPRKHHAVAMARFAHDCLDQTRHLTKRLEVVLGPDTGDLALRVGLHSGPVTAGVLRGEKARFQLFGDTMNTAARMESNGKPNRIHISQETADLLLQAGKEAWITQREDKIHAKGKGELQTYWLKVTFGGTASESRSTSQTFSVVSSCDAASMPAETKLLSEDKASYGAASSASHEKGDEVSRKAASLMAAGKESRLIDWNVDVLLRLLKQVVARRNAMGNTRKDILQESSRSLYGDGHTVLDEVKEIIHLPEFDIKAVSRQQDPDSIELDEKVLQQLHDYVQHIAAMYQDNAFHNFEHASHVTMSVVKLMSRIVAPDLDFETDDQNAVASTMHDHTYGITSNPLTQLACVFSALIHDVDHTGVPNTQLIKENTQLANHYKNKSVAEQNSVDLAWDLLMDDMFIDLRNAIFPTESEKMQFRQVLVNSVMATDIMDKDLKALRNARWEKAFTETVVSEDESLKRNRKATIVIEHLIQASDVAHTMQHWHIYRKWNERLFYEMYEAYRKGRAEKDPSEAWYLGEIGFFDFYIIPLAKKLKECGVFGVSSDEYLNYAQKNRKEWEERGKEVVNEMLQKIQKGPPNNE